MKLADVTAPLAPEIDNDLAVFIGNAVIRPSKTADTILFEVDLKIRKGATVMITGPVGAGKTTLLKAILGEISCDSGIIYVQSRRMAYCSQTPWLKAGTIREAIIGVEEKLVDEAWYDTVIDASALTYDLSKFPASDQTLIGSRGITLSGGQKRYVYVLHFSACLSRRYRQY
jgi:ATP-binding cassette subfamily C (CFTR/MRP) protein 1